MAGELGHDVRVLVCDGCGAPLNVPVQGGFVQCEHCRATLEAVARREPSMARAGVVNALDEQHRLAILRLQDGQPLLPPAELSQFLAAGGLIPAKESVALRVWQELRSELQTRYSTEVERRFHFLTLTLAEHHWAVREHLKSRAMLESATEVCRARRYRQLALCNLARHAIALGDPASALAWMAPCERQPLRLLHIRWRPGVEPLRPVSGVVRETSRRDPRFFVWLVITGGLLANGLLAAHSRLVPPVVARRTAPAIERVMATRNSHLVVLAFDS